METVTKIIIGAVIGGAVSSIAVAVADGTATISTREGVGVSASGYIRACAIGAILGGTLFAIW